MSDTVEFCVVLQQPIDKLKRETFDALIANGITPLYKFETMEPRAAACTVVVAKSSTDVFREFSARSNAQRIMHGIKPIQIDELTPANRKWVDDHPRFEIDEEIQVVDNDTSVTSASSCLLL